jgi:hypothetical protein
MYRARQSSPVRRGAIGPDLSGGGLIGRSVPPTAVLLVLVAGMISATTAAANPDRSALLALAAHEHHPRDPFSLTMQAAAAAFGIEASYEEVYALSSNCFAPDIRPDEECRITWRMRGRGQCLDLVADALGLKVRPLGCFSPREYGRRDRPLKDKMREAAAIVRGALANGEVVITDTGWLHDFMLWGIVTDVRDDGTILGVTPNGRTDNTFDHLGSLWALSPKGYRLSRPEADLRMLRRAVARIRADEEPFLPDSLACGLPAIGAPEVPGAVLWGLPAMDRWVEQMEHVPYQQDDAASGVGNARLCAWHTLHGAEVAARQLRAAAGPLGGQARSALRSAAERYDHIAELLRPAVYGEGETSYGAIMGDPEKQKAHADVLRQVKSELAAAADDIEGALAAEGVGVAPAERAARLRRAELELKGNGWVQETFSLSLVAVARSFAMEASYEEVCARSGQAFAPAIDFVNSCKDLLQCQGWLGHLCLMDAAAGSLGLEIEPLGFPAFEGDPRDAAAQASHHEACAQVIARALAAGDAVITSGGWEYQGARFVEPWWAGIIAEVRADGTVVGAHLNGGAGCEVADISPGEAFVVRPGADGVDLTAVHRRMLREAVARIRSQGDYSRGQFCVFGLDAMDEWMRIMREDEGFCPVCQQRDGNGWVAAVRNAEAVTDRCSVAAAYLRRIAPDFAPSAAEHLEAAAAHYDRMMELLTPALTGRGGEHYRDFVGDLVEQRAHADRVLAVVKDELAAAADDIEGALAKN